MQYFFILGKNHLLSIAEIINLLKSQQVSFTIKHLTSKVLVSDIKGLFNPQDFLRRLGGTVKIGQITNYNFNASDLIKMITKGNEGKVNFGFSSYLIDDKVQSKRLDDLRFKILDLSVQIKKKLKENGRSCRFVVSREKNLSSVIVKTNKLLTHGAEIVLLVGARETLVGQTLAVQEFDEYSSRDYGREYRDAKSGMIPPKLAKIMINLARADLNGIILDPFCGSGTVLQEALLMGYNKVTGSDINERAVHDSKKNIEWLINKFQIPNNKLQINAQFPIFNFQIYKKDVRKISGWLEPGSIDAIVTEPYLGPSNLKHVSVKRTSELGETKKELSELYVSAFEEFKKVLKPGGRVVMVWPVWQVGANKWQKEINEKNLNFLPIIDKVLKLGFRRVDVLSKELINEFHIKQNERKSLIYSRPNQMVLREIMVFERK